MNRSRLWLLSLAHGFVHGVMNIFPVLIPPVQATFGWSLSTAGWVGTAGYVLFGGMALPAGWIADRLDRGTLIKVTVGGMSASLLALGTWTSELGFFLAWPAVCFFAGLYHPLGLSSVVSAGGERTGQAMGWHGFGGNMGFAIMPVVAGLVAARWGWPEAFLVAAVVGVALSVGSVAVIGSVSDASESQDRSIHWNRGLLLVLVMYGFVGFVYRGMVTFIPTSFLQRWSGGIGLGDVGLFTTVIYSIGALGQLGGGWLEDRFDSLTLFGLVTAGHVLAVVGLSFSADVPFFLFLIAWACLFFAGQPILNTLVSRVGNRATHGRLYGAAFTMNLGLGASGAGVTGSLMDLGGLNAGYLGVILGGVAVLFCVLGLFGEPLGAGNESS